jgi:hypothetical protein
VRARGKQGFGAPYRRWLQQPRVRALAEHAFRSDGRLRSLLPGLPTAPGTSYETWTLLTLALWLERRGKAPQ